uniref:Odorant receptor n=1 Tax=Bombyx mori TaxID=7091 RepID=A0A8R2M0G0_BOMMO|nr:uncharacterized protein LOC101736708 isoform X1 [Bombyx mori]
MSQFRKSLRGSQEEPRANGKSENVRFLINSHILHCGLRFNETNCHTHYIAKVAIFCFIVTYMLQVMELYWSKGDQEKLFECFSILSFCGMGVMKLVILRVYHQRWRFLLNQVSILENRHLDPGPLSYDSDNDNDDNEIVTFITKYTDKFKRTSSILIKMYASTLVIYVLSPFVEYIFRQFRGDLNIAYPHILPAWTPLDEFSVTGYLIMVSFETVACIYCVFVHVAFDLTCVGLMIFACGQFYLLRYRSERIGGKGRICRLLKSTEVRAHYRIVFCHGIHVLLVQLIEELDRLIKHILGVYFFLATLTLCSVAVRLKTEDMSITQLVNLLQYMCGTLTQLFLYCKYGDSVYNESSVNMGEGPFAAAIWVLSPKIRRELVILGAGMMRPHRLHAGPFNSLDLPSFIQVCVLWSWISSSSSRVPHV